MPYSRLGRSGSPPHSRSPVGDRRSRSLSRSRRNHSRSNDSDAIANPGNNLYVTGLSTRVTTSALEKYFNNEGKVNECHVVTDPRTKESRGFAFVTMETNEDADRCIKYLNRSVLEGRLITVDKKRCLINLGSRSGLCNATDSHFKLHSLNSECTPLWPKGNVEGHQLLEGTMEKEEEVTRGSHVVTLLVDGMIENAKEDRAPPMVEGSMFPPTLIGSTGNVHNQLVVVAKGEYNCSVGESHNSNGNTSCWFRAGGYRRPTSVRLRVQLPVCTCS